MDRFAAMSVQAARTRRQSALAIQRLSPLQVLVGNDELILLAGTVYIKKVIGRGSEFFLKRSPCSRLNFQISGFPFYRVYFLKEEV